MPIPPLTYAQTLQVLVSLREYASRPSNDEQVAFLGFCLAHAARSRAQFLQDLWVAYELKSQTGGFFVEFGAADGIKFSNSYYLETELGWTGIVAEPARVWREAVARNRTCAVDTRCVWTESGGSITFNQPSIPAHSTIDRFSASDMHAESREAGERYEVETISLNDLLAFWKAPRRIEYLSIDTEGSELEILQHFDFSAWDVRLISVEHNHSENRQPIFDLLAANGYRRKFAKLSNVDDWYVRD